MAKSDPKLNLSSTPLNPDTTCFGPASVTAHLAPPISCPPRPLRQVLPHGPRRPKGWHDVPKGASHSGGCRLLAPRAASPSGHRAIGAARGGPREVRSDSDPEGWKSFIREGIGFWGIHGLGIWLGGFF